MKSFKHILLGFSLVGMFAACSSEEGVAPEPTQPDNRIWEKIDFSMGVEQGKNADTRAMGDLDNQKLPKGAYPSKLGIYMHGYKNEAVQGTLTLNEEGTDNGGKADFYYYMDSENNQVIMKSTPTSKDELKIDIMSLENNSFTFSEGKMEMFFFASQPEIGNITYPTVEVNQYPELFTDAREECGDNLFCTDGYVFKWKSEGVVALYLIIRNSDAPYEVREIKEVASWQKGDWDITMKRLTACVSIRLMIIDHYEKSKDNTWIHINVAGMDKAGINFTDGLRVTNDAFKNYAISKKPELKDELADFSVENLLVRKKVFKNFPVIFTWKDGYLAGLGKKRASLYLCNLDFPSWISDVVDYNHGSNEVHGLTATCDNEPFVFADSKTINNIDLVLFMGYGKRDASLKPQGGTYDKLTALTIPFGDNGDTGSNGYHVAPNTHTYFYVGITLENLLDLYLFQTGRDPISVLKNRSESDINNINIAPEQVKVVSEPYITE